MRPISFFRRSRRKKRTNILCRSSLEPETTVESGTQPRASAREKIISELKELAIITAYLYVCFAALIQLKTAVLHAEGVTYAPLGIAAIKAVICAKFMLLGAAFHVGERFTRPPLIFSTLYRSFAFLVLLIVLNVTEEAIVGVIHGKTILDSIADRRNLVSDSCDQFHSVACPHSLFRLSGTR
jgi:hypothetical protein